jgi:ribosome maturation factor RimP
VGPAIDRADPIENSYCLAVGSPGLGRELKNAFHLGRYIEKEVTVRLFAKNETAGDKSFRASLKEAGDEKKNFKFELLPGGQTIILAKKEIAHICAYDEIDIIKPKRGET